MGGYLGAALLGIDILKSTADKGQRMAKVNKKLGTPWYKQIWETPLASSYIFGDMYVKNREDHLADLQAKARNSTGLAGEGALKKAANSTREIMNQQLNQNIGTINQGWGGAGRYASGARQQAILQAQNSTNFNLANVVNQMSLQESQFQRNLEEERAWRQATLDAGQPGLADKIGDIANLGTQLYGTNPDYFNEKLGGLGEKIGIGGGMISGAEVEKTLPDFMAPVKEMPGGVYPSVMQEQAAIDKPLTLPFNFTKPQGVGEEWINMSQESYNDALMKFSTVPSEVANSNHLGSMLSGVLIKAKMNYNDLSQLLIRVESGDITLEELLTYLADMNMEVPNGRTLQNTK